MARKLKQFPLAQRNKYPWDEWLVEGQAYALDPDIDFPGVKWDTMRNMVHSKALQRGGRARTARTEDGKMAVEFYVPDEGVPTPKKRKRSKARSSGNKSSSGTRSKKAAKKPARKTAAKKGKSRKKKGGAS